ncbi:hypothetical protein BB413_02295 [Helicobacter pylori]|uniref:Uncharacterized protein n=1 Tax=Helicobacter pylori TaxID=210 RepID=A0A2A6XFK3_HELPX|nr:hypothetical protein BB413_02295 [Helicobacter pylori]
MIENCFSFKRIPTLELDCHAIGDTSENKAVLKEFVLKSWLSHPFKSGLVKALKNLIQLARKTPSFRAEM